MKPYSALRRMRYATILRDPTSDQTSCASYALASWACNGQPSVDLLDRATSYMRPFQSVVGDGVFGVPSGALTTAYDRFGLAYTHSIRVGFVPLTCILKMFSSQAGGCLSHVAARIDGTILDTFDCRAPSHAFKVVGFYATASPVR